MILGGVVMPTIKDEIDAYEAMRPDLEAANLGQWALVRERKLVRIFDDFERAAAEAVRLFGRGPYLIRQIGAPPATLPASVLLRPH